MTGAPGHLRRKAERRGRSAEFLVGILYRLQGYQILETRYRAPGGEIDLIARRGKLIAFIEVKRRDDENAAIAAVTPKNRRRLESAARSFAARRPHFDEFAFRYDIAAVSRFRIKLVKDAWRADAA
ncbi:MAG: YraN family protein [Parvularculaceae bacterium]|nr:YraN family protein [Parvularculaceae bacterium]